jgi:hypothetical protein
MALNFPNSPTNGQKFVDSNGQSWVYNTTNNSWTAEGFPRAGMVYKGAVDITAAPPSGVIAGWTYVVSADGTANAGFNPNLSGSISAGTQIIFDGTRWDLLSQTVPNASDTVSGRVELATNAETLAGTDTARAVTPAGAASVYTPLDFSTRTDGTSIQGSDIVPVRRGTQDVRVTATQLLSGVPNATESVRGTVELATNAETTAGTDGTRAVHPKGLKVELDKKLDLSGGTLTGVLNTKAVHSPENTITAGAFDLNKGPYWTCGAIAVPNPTNAVAGMSGLIRLTAAPTGFGANFKHPGGAYTAPAAFPAIVPFYVQNGTTILLGKAVEGIS